MNTHYAFDYLIIPSESAHKNHEYVNPINIITVKTGQNLDL